MKKILIIIGKLSIGGAEKVAYDIGHYRDKNKFDCHYIVFDDYIGEYEEQLTNDGCKIIHMPVPASNYRLFMNNLKTLMQKEKYDVVHCHTMFNSGLVMLMAKMQKVPCRISHSHSICSSKNRKVTKKIYEHIMRWIINRNSTRCVGCGKDAGEWLFGKKKFDKSGVLVYNGIDTSIFKFNEESRIKIREKLKLSDNFVIGHVGHLAKVKNQEFLIKLMPQILKINPKARLLLLGEGDDRQKLELLIKENGLENYVIMTGNVMNVHEYLSTMDVFAFPSLYEGMPLSIIEVQSNGLPCVISDAVPQDVFLTDLLTKLSLQADESEWIKAICSASRNKPEKYSGIMFKTGFDNQMMLQKIYGLYEGK